MEIYYFPCHYEERDYPMKINKYSNDYLFLYEIEPEDRILNERFGVKFITQLRDSLLEMRCTNSITDHFQYELAIVHGLRQFLVSAGQHD